MQRTKLNVLVVIAALALVFAGARTSAAPEPGRQGQSGEAAKREAAPDSRVYRVSYKVNEMENGRIINSRSYTLMAKAGDRAQGNIGSTIPVVFQGKLDYNNVGMDFSCIIHPQQEGLLVHSEFNLRTLAEKEAASTPAPPPVTRRLFLSDDTLATVGKPAFVGSIDDVASNRRFVIEVTVTKAR